MGYTQKLLTINDIYELDESEYVVSDKSLDNGSLIKHYIVLFILDLLDGVIGAVSLANEVDQVIVNQIFTQVKKFLHEVHNNRMELVQTYVDWVNFHSLTGRELQNQNIRYSKTSVYNVTGIAQTCVDLINDKANEILLVHPNYLINQLSIIYLNQRTESKTKIYDTILLIISEQMMNSLVAKHNFASNLLLILLAFVEKAGYFTDEN